MKNEDLKIKVKFGKDGFEIEIDGEKNAVKEEWSKIKSDGLGRIINDTEIIYSKPPDISIDEGNSSIPLSENTTMDGKFPDIMNVVYRNLPNSESEWLLVYSYYAKDFNIKPISKDDLLKMYDETKRKSVSNTNNIKNNLKSLLNKGYINFINDDDFVLLDKGEKQVLEILKRSSSSTRKQISKSNKKINQTAKEKKSKAKKSSQLKETLTIDSNLNLMPKNEISLKEFYSKYSIKGSHSHFLLFVYYLKKNLKINNINLNQIYTCFKELKIMPPNFFKQTATNVKNQKGWIDTTDMNDIKLTQVGENEVEFKFDNRE